MNWFYELPCKVQDSYFVISNLFGVSNLLAFHKLTILWINFIFTKYVRIKKTRLRIESNETWSEYWRLSIALSWIYMTFSTYCYFASYWSFWDTQNIITPFSWLSSWISSKNVYFLTVRVQWSESGSKKSKFNIYFRDLFLSRLFFPWKLSD